jgi:tRNA(Ile)-lysidine synthase
LGEPRAVLLAWAQAEGLRWVEDPSNAGSQRGQLRALWPALEAIQGGLSGALARTARLLAREDALLERIVDEGWPRLAQTGGLSLAGLRAEDPALHLRYLRRLCAEAGLSAPRAERLEAALAFAGEEGEVELGSGARLRFGEGLVSIVT